MTLQQLRYTIAVADNVSMSEAAKSLFISQPTLSNAIRDLEKEIGVQLFTRNNKGITVSVDGKRFLAYARQVIEQTQLLEEEYLGLKPKKQRFSISTQHYSFAVNAFISLLQEYGIEEYDFTFRETRTYEIIDDVRNLRSEIGILYLNDFNEKVLTKLFKESHLVFEELLIAKPHVFVCSSHPLAHKKKIGLEELKDYPYLSFEQGDNNSFYFSEEILSTLEHSKHINISDRATLFNLLIGLNGYTISTGIICEALNGTDKVTIPLDVNDQIRIGTITHKDVTLSKLGEIYMEALREYIPHD